MIRRRCTADEVDGFAVYCGELGRAYSIPAGAALQLRLRPPRNNHAPGIRWASDYEFAARLKALQGP
jgi:hypothetical protein